VFLEATLPYLDVVWQVARHAAGDGQEPEDLVQETYLRAYAAFGSCRGESMRAWLAAIPNGPRCHGPGRREADGFARRPVPGASRPRFHPGAGILARTG
jgi:RNA polymerase sigma-70 factor (ECF subfamily)